MNDDGSQIASVGSDKMVCVWDTRNTQTPIFVNEESGACIMKCDFTVDQKAVVSSTLEGVINVLDIQNQKMAVAFDTINEINTDPKSNITSNIIFCVKSLKNHPDGGNKFAVGAEMKTIVACDVNLSSPEEVRIQTYGKYVGHYSSVRHIEVSDDYKYMLSSSEDHSIFLWNNETLKPDHILAGHTDLCVSIS